MAKKQRERRPRTETLANLLMPVYDDQLEQSLGNRLRELRRQQSLSLRALAEKSGLSANTLSLIENGKTSPSVSTLQQIAMALNIPITGFFEFKSNRSPVIFTQQTTRPTTSFAMGTVADLGKSNGVEGLQTFFVTFNPRSESTPELLPQEGVEFVYCLSGQVVYSIGEEKFTLTPGDSIMFAAKMTHAWVNPLDIQAQALIILAIAEEKHRTPQFQSPF